jgi:hypothetical protein
VEVFKETLELNQIEIITCGFRPRIGKVKALPYGITLKYLIILRTLKAIIRRGNMGKYGYSDEYVEMWNNCLDECNPVVKIGTLEYNPSWVLEQVDPTAYRIGLDEFIQGFIDDAEDYDRDQNPRDYQPGDFDEG